MTVFLALGGLLLALFGLPYEHAKSVGDFFARDGHLEVFSQEFHTAWRMVWIAGVGFLAMGGGMVVQRQKTLITLDMLVVRTAISLRRLVFDAGDIGRGFRRIFTNRAELALLSGLVLVSFLNKAVLLSKPLGHDEAYTVMAFAVRPLRFLVADYHLPNNHIFHTILVHLSLGLGKEPWIVRLPAFFAGVLLTPASYLAARLMFRRSSVARLAAMLISVVPVLSTFSANARGYTLLCLLTLIALASANFVRGRDNRAGWVVLTLASVFGFYTIPIMVYPAGMVYGWLFVSGIAGDISETYGGKLKFFKRLILSILTGVLTTLMVYMPVFLVSGVKSVFGNSFVAPLSWGRFTAGLVTHWGKTWQEWGSEVPVWIVGISVVCFVSALVFHKTLTRQVVPFPVAGIGWIALLLYVQRVAPVSRIWLFALPLYLLYVAAGGVFLIEPLTRGMSKLRIGVFVLLFSAVVFWSISGTWQQYQETQAQPYGKTELLTLSLCEILQPQDVVVVETTNAPALWYYFYLHGLPDTFFYKGGEGVFRQIYVVVDKSEKETLESVMERQHFKDIIEETTVQLVVTKGTFTLYQVQPKAKYRISDLPTSPGTENLCPSSVDRNGS